MSDQTLLAEVEAAISAILAGVQSYAIATADGSRSFRYADLKTLYDMRSGLTAGAARAATGGGIRVRGATPNG